MLGFQYRGRNEIADPDTDSDPEKPDIGRAAGPRIPSCHPKIIHGLSVVKIIDHEAGSFFGRGIEQQPIYRQIRNKNHDVFQIVFAIQ